MKTQDNSIRDLEGKILTLRGLVRTNSKIPGSERLAIRKQIIAFRREIRKQARQIEREKKRREEEFLARRAEIISKAKALLPKEFSAEEVEKQNKIQEVLRSMGLDKGKDVLLSAAKKATKTSLRIPDFSKLDKRKLALKQVEFLYVIAQDPEISDADKERYRKALGLDVLERKQKYGTAVKEYRDRTVPMIWRTPKADILVFCWVFTEITDISVDYEFVILPEYQTENFVSGKKIRVKTRNLFPAD